MSGRVRRSQKRSRLRCADRRIRADPAAACATAGSVKSCNVRVSLPRSLLELDGGASLFQLSLGLLGVFLLGLLQDGLRSAINHGLGVSQTSVGDGLDSLDDLDLLVADSGQDDVELGLLFLLDRKSVV